MNAGQLTVKALSRDGETDLGTGKLLLIDNQINQTTGTIRLKATMPNPNHSLWPNQFVKARLMLELRKDALTIPAVAVQRGPQGTFVYVVKSDSTAEMRAITVDSQQDDTTIIAKGLSAGEQVVIDGQYKLRPRRTGVAQNHSRPKAHQPHGARATCGGRRPRRSRTMANVSEPFIRRPIATSLLMVGLLLAGMAGYTQLPVAALPQVDYPTITVAANLPGASPETMASSVTTPLERQFGQVPSLGQMSSVSSFGTSQITLQFDLARQIDAAQQDVQAAINTASNLLPKTLPTPPTYSKSNPADAPVLTLAVSSDLLPLSEVDNYADSILAQKISQVSGVGLVTLGGGQKPAVRIQADPESLAGLGPLARRRARRDSHRQRQRAKRHDRRQAPSVHHRRRRPAANRGRLQTDRDQRAKRRARALG